MRLSYLVPSRPDEKVVFSPLTLQNVRATRRISTMTTIELAYATLFGLLSAASGYEKREPSVLSILNPGSAYA